MHCYAHFYDSLHLNDGMPSASLGAAIHNGYKNICFETQSNTACTSISWPLWGRGFGGDIKDSRVSQEEEVEHRVVLAEINQCPAEDPATHGQQAEPSCDENDIA